MKTILALVTTLLYLSLDAQSIEQSEYQKNSTNTIRFARPVNTGLNHTLLILGSAWQTSPELGDEIAVYDSNGNMVGSIAWRPEQQGHAGIAIWGDDPSTSEKEGMYKGEAFSIYLYDKSENNISSVTVDSWHRGNHLFVKDGVSVVEHASVSKPSANAIELFQNIPNPVVDSLEIFFYLPSDEDQVTLILSDTDGKVKRILLKDALGVGMHNTKVNVIDLANGNYIYTLSTKNKTLNKQFTISK